MTNYKQVYILPLVNNNVYWPIMGIFILGTISCLITLHVDDDLYSLNDYLKIEGESW